MRKLYLTFCLLFLVSGLVFAQDQLTIGWNTSSIEVDASVSGQQVFVVLKWEDNASPTQGIWSFQIDITSTTITIGTGDVALYGSLSSNFTISKSSITNGVRVLVYGKTNRRMFAPGYNAAVLTLTLPSLSAGSYSIALSNASAVKRDYPSGANPTSQAVTLSPSTINITASTFTAPSSSPTFTGTGYTTPRKYGDINWDTYVNIADVTGLADVLVGNYGNVNVYDPENNWYSGTPNYRYFYESYNGETPINYDDNVNIDNNDSTAANVYGSSGSPDNTLDLMDLATLEDAVTSGVWPSYAIGAIAGLPAGKINGGPGIGSGILAKVEGSGARFEKVATDVFVKFEVFNSGQKGSKIRVTVDNNSAELRGLQIELASSVLPGKLDVWSLPDASGLKVAWKRNEFNKIVILVYADGGKVMKSGSASYVTIVVPNVTREQILGAEPKVIASIKNISYDVNYDVTEASGIVPLNYMLYQNYPNPFNPGTKIEFEVPEYSNVKLIIWNSLGQKVKEIYSGAVDPNRYSVYWDGKDENGLSVASGIYFVTMYARSLEEQGREFTMTRKMILMK
jgi:hypothetical protein